MDGDGARMKGGAQEARGMRRGDAEPAAETDAVIVGAGPSGAAAAVRLRALGLKVVLLDKERFPRHKICGDFLPPGAVEGLRSLCGAAVEDLLHAPLEGLRITWRGRSILADFPPGS